MITYPQQELEAKLKRQERLKQLKERLGSNGWRAKKRVRLFKQIIIVVQNFMMVVYRKTVPRNQWSLLKWRMMMS